MLVRPLTRPLVSALGDPLRENALPWDEGVRGGGAPAGAAPTISVAPVASGTVTIGGTLTTTDGTWTGSPTSYTYQWRRAGVNIGGATAAAYVVVAADISDTIAIDCVVTAINAFGSGTADSNSLAFAPDTAFPDGAIGLSTSGLTLADSNTTIDQWAAVHGGQKANVVLAAPAATNRPAYSASGGPGGRPAGVFDGVDNVLRDAAVDAFGGTWGGMELHAVGFLAGAETGADVIMRYQGTQSFTLNVTTTPQARGTSGGAGGASSTGTTTITATSRQITFDWNGSSQSIRVNNSAEDTDAATPAAYSDAGSVALGASVSGTTATAGTWVGWAVNRGALSASQRADLRAFFQNKLGIS
jgi:hypothetical protein